ncbi:prepilin-type N-terminal cleavage/methylation domain-containing protein [Clostridium sp. Sa3CUN1]|uniref:Prepilin-type N-terminal cleavage/methylation domain-containing protein n=1 Tax=Clostridium gallinarum TaxID=2762246 RepID=A0ABR8Q6D8_9CLOT|nr:prepilin-type N-terminal cleavage/methylation domain-containing protein [Clostridium gallinarum]MBD7915995.1 prepilin-type N-terminal cleavage/methylation domain-containing protein [Clostridium gallinarum]
MILNLKNRKNGFTLIELIIVIAIIAILAAIAIPKFAEIRNNANSNADIANSKQIQSAVALAIASGKTSTDTGTFIWGEDNTAGSLKGEAYKQIQNEKIKPKLDRSKNFVVKVTSGDIKVYIAESTSGALTDANQIYPEPNTITNNIWYGGNIPTLADNNSNNVEGID